MTDDSTPARLSEQMLNVRQFGAAGDGQTDDTQALQAAIDAAMAQSGQVYFLPGVYACSTIRLKPHLTLTGCATWLRNSDDRVSKHITITGNVLHRSGAHARNDDEIANSHMVLDGCRGVVVSGNTMSIGQDDDQQGIFTPAYGVTYRQIGECIIRDNVLYAGALRQLIRDLGDNDEASVMVRDNIGSLARPEIRA